MESKGKDLMIYSWGQHFLLLPFSFPDLANSESNRMLASKERKFSPKIGQYTDHWFWSIGFTSKVNDLTGKCNNNGDDDPQILLIIFYLWFFSSSIYLGNSLIWPIINSLIVYNRDENDSLIH